ncbi:hypothetical protein IA539_17155 [Gordonia sp. zg691]|uniref:DUF6777 domain-containing protein n=1 Tax=Gordonia jinghuaiqii TaxID=2758710 RepID=A0A7D7QPU0_9ACTN|nr:DUF6777 domain-containing protein [Gordonia jinghuaiqii]MBD0862914.1 hypothetical protein [Gordonia jinghuaiqii]MCR5978961.1 hypothetical protein [Gordonia jinghuaiqii]QMT01706.1 hypothetical protein H1R19_00360 [Gordonia jinghuaiqii]
MTYPPGPPAHPSTPFGAIPPEPRGARTLTLVLGAIVVVLALVLAGGIVFVLKARDGDIYVPGLTLTAANDPGIDPFTDPVLVAGAGTLPDNVALTGSVGASDLGGRAVNGTEPGLYGTGDSAACDTAALSNRLLADPPTAQAWASVYGIGTADIPHYLNTLTPVVLTADTWVTNHSFTSGRAVPFQSILQRGTAVYVDSAGVPRAMCSCGNPLAPPAAAPLGGYRLEGQPWRGYQSRSVTRIAYADQNVTTVHGTTTIVPGTPQATGTPGAPILQLLDILTGQIFGKPAGGLLDVSGLAPPTGPLPTPAALNTPFRADTEDDAEHNGLAGPGNPAPAQAVEKRAAEDGGLPEGAPASDSPGPGVDQPAPASENPRSENPGSEIPGADVPGPASSAPDGPAPESPAPAPGGSEIPPAPPASEVPPATPPTPTSFSGVGEVIADFAFDDAGLAVGCDVPSVAATGSVELTCTDNVPRSVPATALRRSSVAGATDPTGVWTLSLTTTGSSETVVVRSATWTVDRTDTPTTTAPATPTHVAPPAEETHSETTTTTTTTEYVPPPEEPSPASPETPAEVPSP